MSRWIFAMCILLTTLLVIQRIFATEQPLHPVKVDRFGDPLPPNATVRLGTTRFRHESDFFSSLSFSPNGKYLTGFGPNIHSWDTSTGRTIRKTQNAIPDNVSELWSPGVVTGDCRTLIQVYGIANSAECKVRWIDRVQGIVLDESILQGTRNNTKPKVCSSPDRMLLAVSPDSACVYLIQTETKKIIHRIKDPLQTFAFSPDSLKLAIASDHEPKVTIWDVKTGKRNDDILLSGKDTLSSLAYSQDGKAIALGISKRDYSTKSRVILWSIETKKEIAHLEVEDSFAEVVGFTAEGSDLIISEELNAKVLIWNCMNKKNRLTLEIGNTGPIAVSPDGRTLAVVPRKTQNVRLWSLVTGKELFPDFQDGHASGIVSLVFSPDSKHVASASFWDSTLYWDMRTEKPKYKINDRGFRLLSFLPSGNNLIMFPGERVSDGNGLLVWDRDLRKTTRLIAGSEKELLPGELKLAVLVDNAKTLVTVGKKGDAFSDPNALVVIWDLAKQTRLREFAIADISAHSLAASSDGSIAAIGTYNGEIVLVNLSNGKTIMTLEAGEDPQDVVLALGSRMVVSWVTKDKISAWELLTGKEIFHLQHKCKLRSAMAISSDGCWLATTDGHRIWIWDLILGKPTIEFSNFDSEITCLAFSPDGMVLGSGCNNSTILLWDTSSLAASRRDLPVVDKKCLLSCWDNLASVDARKGHESMWMLIASPQQTVPYLRAKLAPARSIPEKRFRQLVSELDDDDYQVRDSAFQNLACQEEQITQRLRNELDNNLTAEQRSRIEKLLDLPPIVRTPDRMRSLRAVQILERIGNSDAKAVLKILTTGAPEARLTQEAKESIIRLEACEKLKVP